MESKESQEPISGEKRSGKAKWLDIISIILLVNLGLVILVSILAAILNPEYINELMVLGFVTVVLLIIVIILTLVLSLGLPMIARRLFKWEEEKETDWIVNLLFLFSFLFVIITAIALYALALPSFPVVQDPFNFSEINSTLGTLYSIWWFFGFIISALFVALIYFILETGRYT